MSIRRKHRLGGRPVTQSANTAHNRATTGHNFSPKKWVAMSDAEKAKIEKKMASGDTPLRRGAHYDEKLLKQRRAALAKKTAQRRGEGDPRKGNKAHRDL